MGLGLKRNTNINTFYMDTTKYKAICQQLVTDLEVLAKKYDLSNFGFIGFVGEPGKGHTPVCLHSVTKPQFQNHLHIMLSKAVFYKAVEDLKKMGGTAYDLSL